MKTKSLFIAFACVCFSLQGEELSPGRSQQDPPISPSLETSNWAKDHSYEIWMANIIIYGGIPLLHYYLAKYDSQKQLQNSPQMHY